jgi:hypothetical protein
MVTLYFGHVAAMYVARDPRSDILAPPVEKGQIIPVLKIPRGDGNEMIAAFPYHLTECRKPEAGRDFDRVWLVGALLSVGYALSRHGYFGHAPEAEIVRHLRNGVAHGNKFGFADSVKDATTGRLKKPANTARYAARQGMPVREVETHLQGTEVLFAWGGPDAVVDCLTVLGIHLWQSGHGLPCP